MVDVPYVKTFTPKFFNNFTNKPIFVETERQLRDLCKKHGVSSGALL